VNLARVPDVHPPGPRRRVGILPIAGRDSGRARAYGRRVKRLPVDLALLAALFDQPRGGPVRAFFDRDSGTLESMPRDVEVEGVFDDILAAPLRWVEIQPLPAAERRQLRWRFVDQEITDPHLRLRLFETLEAAGVQPLLRWEALLRDRAGLLDRWFEFRASALAPLVRAWLSALDIEA
jgi:hypothetical protein